MDHSDRGDEALSGAGSPAGTKVDSVLQESAKLAEITRQRRRQAKDETKAETVFELKDLAVTYGGSYAVQGVDMLIRKNEITALIGPSGCGKTTVLRCLNRMNDLIPGAKVEGKVLYHGIDLYGPKVEPVEVRRRIGMVFQKPNPFPKSIYDNIAFGPRVGGYKGNMDELVERSLRRAALWDEVKDDLKASAMALSGGQQQRLCIARCIAVEPDVILMDEPCSALDPISTAQDRRAHGRTGVRVHDRHRDAQHAAGRPRQRPHRVLHRGRGAGREGPPHRHPRRVRHDTDGVHQPERLPHRGLRDRSVRLRRDRAACAVSR